MKKSFQFLFCLIFGGVFACPVVASTAAQFSTLSEPVSMATDQRIVTYTYSPNVIYRIYTSPLLHTHIELGEDEGLKETPVAGDTIQWRISGGPRHIYVKPIRSNISTSMTIVTNKRTYQFQLIALEKPKQLYQKVSFELGSSDKPCQLLNEVKPTKDFVGEQKENNTHLQKINSTNSNQLSSLDFNFKLTGEAKFKPLHVFTDGKMTYVKLPNTQDVPAIFLTDKSKQLSLVNYRLDNDVVIIERLASHLLLKLGEEEVFIDYVGNLQL